MKKFLSSKLFKAIWSLILVLLIYFFCPPFCSKPTLIISLGTLFVLINRISRFAVGGLFIFSGFIKANDPVGFSYKLKEYFEVFKEDSGLEIFEAFAHIALPLAVLLCVSEMALGFMLLVGYRKKLTLGLLLTQIIFFTFLTFYSAYFNKVTSCGCFGDFLVLKPWESFGKDIALLILIIDLFIIIKSINELFSPLLTITFTLLAILLSVLFPIYTYRNLPVFDFRAYKIGDNIKKNMEAGADYQPAKYESILVYKNLKTNELREFSNDEYNKLKIWEDTLTWAWAETKNKLIHDAINPPKIMDFSIQSLDGYDLKDSVLNNKDYMFLLIAWDLNETESDPTLHAKINDLYKLASGDKIKMLALTQSDAKLIDNYKHDHQALYDFANGDGTVLKTMIRSNPGLILIKDGTVIMNWHYNNFPSYSDAKQKYMK